jgi:hypothetical protein
MVPLPAGWSWAPVARAMPLTSFLKGTAFDPEATRAMGVAFEKACAALQLADRTDPVVGLEAKRIIVLAKAAERKPDRLCEGELNEKRVQRP